MFGVVAVLVFIVLEDRSRRCARRTRCCVLMWKQLTQLCTSLGNVTGEVCSVDSVRICLKRLW